jgi:2,3-bisphosphoglycerate-dependent phosphoglycerate mutase
VVGHGNSLRALCTLIDELSDEEVEQLNIPAGHPLRYEFAPDGRVVFRGYLDPVTAHADAVKVAAEGGT